ncbi:MAG: TPM domain-containing protein [Pirellulales bacterium]|nr:TPM domain-containing protein [Pirellulales bacterium]
MSPALVISLLLTGVVQPLDTTRRVHDFAGVIPADEGRQLEALCQEVEQQTTAQVAIVTVPSLDGVTVEEYATELFKEWGIGKRDVNNGILLLVAPNERRIRIEVGYGLEPLLTDGLCGEIRDQAILPAFRQLDYAGGIRAGADRIVDVLRANPQAAKGYPGSGPYLLSTVRQEALVAIGVAIAAAILLIVVSLFAAARRKFSTWYFVAAAFAVVVIWGIAVSLTLRLQPARRPWVWLGSAGALVAGSMWQHWRKYRRYGPRGCSKCGTPFELLGEQADDEHLNEVQRLEEKIGSVDYDVWYCPACLHADTEAYINYFSNFSRCPKCQYRTFKEGPQQTIRAATTLTSGLARVEGRCVHCNHKTLREIVLPRLAVVSSGGSSGSSFGSSSFGGGSSSSGGGSSFGGGSSGGGGASGSW